MASRWNTQDSSKKPSDECPIVSNATDDMEHLWDFQAQQLFDNTELPEDKEPSFWESFIEGCNDGIRRAIKRRFGQ
jgi:hypothetical protein